LKTLREDMQFVIGEAVKQTNPKRAVQRALEKLHLSSGGRLRVIAVGKAGWTMAQAAAETLGGAIESGLVITKYKHVQGALPRFAMLEAGHPLTDANSVRAADAAMEMVRDLTVEDTVLFLLSGGGSALFEKPLLPLEDYIALTDTILKSGADITDFNVIRKRLSAVKGGRFAQLCAPAKVIGLILSDVIGDAVETIASGPVSPDPVRAEEAERTLLRVMPDAPEAVRALMRRETPKMLANAETMIIGNVGLLVSAASEALQSLGYETVILTDRLACEAAGAGRFLASIAQYYQTRNRAIAFLAGGETVVHVTGSGLGGRNQELALAAAPMLAGLPDTAVFSFGSDGTDGPTDAAGGFADGQTVQALKAAGIDADKALADHDSYHALQACDGLIMTGPTGTNVNDVAVVLIR